LKVTTCVVVGRWTDVVWVSLQISMNQIVKRNVEKIIWLKLKLLSSRNWENSEHLISVVNEWFKRLLSHRNIGETYQILCKNWFWLPRKCHKPRQS